MKRILQGAVAGTSKCCEFRGKPSSGVDRSLCPLELALGWPAGLYALLGAGVNPLHAWTVATYRNDIDSLRILLTTKADIRADIDTTSDYPETIKMIAKSSNQEMRLAMLDYLRRTNGSDPNPVTSAYKALSQSVFVRASESNVLCFMNELYESGLGEIGINGTDCFVKLCKYC